MSDPNYYHGGMYVQQPLPPPPETDSPHPPADEPKPKKQKRIRRACDFCHSRSTKCRQNPIPGQSCLVCLEFSQPCTSDRPEKKRGIPGKTYRPPTAPSLHNALGGNDGENDARMLLELTGSVVGVEQATGEAEYSAVPEKWKGMILTNEENINDLALMYSEYVHPVYPIFHIPTLKQRMVNREYMVDPAFFAEVMAVCALTCAKASDLGLVTSKATVMTYSIVQSLPLPHSYFEIAHDVMPRWAGDLRSLSWMRALSLLALYGYQTRNADVLHHYLGFYTTVVNMDGLDKETNWPRNLGLIETEERRRLFWSMYSFEVITSATHGGNIRLRESNAKVAYASEIEDDLVTEEGYKIPQKTAACLVDGRVADPKSWLHAWNVAIDIYRTLERCLSSITTPQSDSGGFKRSFEHLQSDNAIKTSVAEIKSSYSFLPPELKVWKPARPIYMEGLDSDKPGMQAANILLTLQLVLICSCSRVITLNDKLQLVNKLLDTIAQIPISLLINLCTPHSYHLAGVASILRSVMERRMSLFQCNFTVQLLQRMARLIGTIEKEVSSRKEKYLAEGLQQKINSMNAFIEQVAVEEQNKDLQPTSPDDVNIDPSLSVGRPKKKAKGGKENTVVEEPEDVIVQLPADIVENWPWSFDISRGFGSV